MPRISLWRWCHSFIIKILNRNATFAAIWPEVGVAWRCGAAFCVWKSISPSWLWREATRLSLPLPWFWRTVHRMRDISPWKPIGGPSTMLWKERCKIGLVRWKNLASGTCIVSRLQGMKPLWEIHQLGGISTRFLQDFAFDSLESAKSIRGIGPVECAILSNDVSMIPFLAHSGFDLSRNVSAKINVEILQNGRSALDFALELCWRSPEVIVQLLRCKANVNHTDHFGFSPLGACKTAHDVELLVKHSAHVNKTAGPLHVSPLTLCCVRGAPAEVAAKLIEHQADVNPPTKGVNSPHPLANLAVWSCSNPHCIEVAKLLLDAKCDINSRCQVKGVFKAIEMLNRTRLRLFGSESLLVHFFAEWTTTPLGFACFYGGDEFVEFLLLNDADPNIPKSSWQHSVPARPWAKCSQSH